MGAMTWEEYWWKLDKVIAVPPMQEGRIKLLDIFVQDGVAIQRRVMRRIGSMVKLGDMGVDGWPEERQNLDENLLALDDPKNAIAEEPFSKGFDAAGVINVEVSRASKFLASALDSVQGGFQHSDSLKIEILSPSYQRVIEEDLIDYISGGDNGIPLWKPNLQTIARKDRKTRSIFGANEDLELWIVTELKFCSALSDKSTRRLVLDANVKMPPGADMVALAAGIPIAGAGGVNASRAAVKSKEIVSNVGRDILYGFKAVRLKFDKQGSFVSQKAMGNKQVDITRAGAEVDEFNPDEDPEYHMGTFFLGDRGSGDEAVHNGDFECTPLVLDDTSDDEDRIEAQD